MKRYLCARFLAKALRVNQNCLLGLRLPQFSEHKIQALTKLNSTLKLLEIAINELSKNSTTLVEAEIIFQFISKNKKNPRKHKLLRTLKMLA